MIDIHDISKIYQMGSVEVAALQNVSLTVSQGEMLAIMGPSGSGKSTMMNILGCLDVATSGKYVLEGEDVGQHINEAMKLIEDSNEELRGVLPKNFNTMESALLADLLRTFNGIPIFSTGCHLSLPGVPWK